MDFGENLKLARENKGYSQQTLADLINEKASTDLKRNTISNYENGTSKPSFEILAAIVNILDITADKLLGIAEKTGYAQLNAQQNAQLTDLDEPISYTKKLGKDKKQPISVQKVESLPKEHIVDTSGLSLVPIVDIKAAAGGAGYLNHEAISADDVIKLPVRMIKSGYHLCIRIKGPSMAPTFQDGGYLVIRLLDRSEWLNMRSEYCYVIVDQEGKTYFKRVKNRFSGMDGGFIVCMSDNPDKMSHPNFNLHPDEIQYIWYVEWYFTAKMPNIHDQYYSRVSNLEDQVQLLAEEFRNLQKHLK